MKCPACGREVADDARECPACEAPLDVTLVGPAPRRGGAGAAAPPVPAPSLRAPAGPVVARFLLSAALPAPIQLESGTIYRIGRDRASAVFVPSNLVSRVHAEISDDGKGEWAVSDLSSRNGTFVNGERIIRRVLRHGDRITVGQFDVVFCEADEAEARFFQERREKGSAADTAKLAFAGEVLFGDLANVALSEVTQLLNHNRKTGCLAIREKGATGERRIYFREGTVVHAEFGPLEGERAFEAALRLREGRFAFRPGVEPARETVTTPTPALLLKLVEGP